MSWHGNLHYINIPIYLQGYIISILCSSNFIYFFFYCHPVEIFRACANMRWLKYPRQKKMSGLQLRDSQFTSEDDHRTVFTDGGKHHITMRNPSKSLSWLLQKHFFWISTQNQQSMLWFNSLYFPNTQFSFSLSLKHASSHELPLFSLLSLLCPKEKGENNS